MPKKMIIEYGRSYSPRAKYWGRVFQKKFGFEVLYREVPEQVLRIKIGRITYEREDIPYLIAKTLFRGENRGRQDE